jgi:hypothetical protein
VEWLGALTGQACVVTADISPEPDRPGPPVVLRQSRIRNSATVVFGLLAGVVGFFSGTNGDWVGWVILVGGAVFLLVGSASVASPQRLELDATTMTAVGPFGTRSYDLRRCGPFHLWRVPAVGVRSYLIAFEYPGRRHPRTRFARFWNREAGGNACVLTYDYDAEELVAMLDDYRAGALRTTPEPPGLHL